MKQKKAIVTGITGQDGAYLADLLLKKGYQVIGLKRRSSLFNTARIDYLFENIDRDNPSFIYSYMDLTDSSNIIRLIKEHEPEEIYNLAAQSHVKVSFDTPEYTANADGIGTLRILEAIRICGLEQKTKFYQASTSELFGKVQEVPQKETTPFYPRSPYAVAKLYAYWMVVNYREAHNIHASNGILFNHESPLRGETFVTRKITRAIANIALGHQKNIRLGNINAKRDWGHAKDYVKAMWLMMQQEMPDDYVIATGVTTSVRDFIRMCFDFVGIEIDFRGDGIDEQGIIAAIDATIFEAKLGFNPHHLKVGQILIEIDPYYFRPTEVELLIGDSSKAREKLGWKPEHDLGMLVRDMMASDLMLMQKNDYLKKGGFILTPSVEDIL